MKYRPDHTRIVNSLGASTTDELMVDLQEQEDQKKHRRVVRLAEKRRDKNRRKQK